jgi:hypothetical protein
MTEATGSMTNAERLMSLPYSPDESVPTHEHEYEFNYVDYEGSMGDVSCAFSYTIPPGPRGKWRRERKCGKWLSPEDVLEVLRRCAQ